MEDSIWDWVLIAGVGYAAYSYFTGTGLFAPSSVVATTASVPSSVIPLVDIDYPGSGATISGSSQFVGWAVDTVGANKITGMSALIDGIPVGSPSYGGTRTDVAAAYPNAGANVGWSFNYNANGLAVGQHTLEIVAVDSTGATGSKSIPFSVAQGVSGLRGIISEVSGIGDGIFAMASRRN